MKYKEYGDDLTVLKEGTDKAAMLADAQTKRVCVTTESGDYVCGEEWIHELLTIKNGEKNDESRLREWSIRYALFWEKYSFYDFDDYIMDMEMGDEKDPEENAIVWTSKRVEAELIDDGYASYRESLDDAIYGEVLFGRPLDEMAVEAMALRTQMDALMETSLFTSKWAPVFEVEQV